MEGWLRELTHTVPEISNFLIGKENLITFLLGNRQESPWKKVSGEKSPKISH